MKIATKTPHEYLQVRTGNIRIHTDRYGNVQVTYVGYIREHRSNKGNKNEMYHLFFLHFILQVRRPCVAHTSERAMHA